MDKKEIMLNVKKVIENYKLANQLLLEANDILLQDYSPSEEELELWSNDTEIIRVVEEIEKLREELNCRLVEV